MMIFMSKLALLVVNNGKEKYQQLEVTAHAGSFELHRFSAENAEDNSSDYY